MTPSRKKSGASMRVTHRFRAKAALAAAVAILAMHPARAAETQWVENEGGAVRIVATPPAADGTIRAAVDIRLEPGWTTYWMNPGDAGIPPTLGTEGSTNLASATLRFPAPIPLDEGGVSAIGYDSSVALPLLIRQEKTGLPTVLKARLFLGVCKDICIPVQASYSLAIAPGEIRAGPAAIRVASAFAALPEPPSADFGIEAAELSNDGKMLRIDIRAPEAEAQPSLFLAGPPGWSFGEAKRAADQAKSRFAVPVTDAPKGETLRGRSLVVVATSGARSMQDTVTIR